MEEYLGQWKTLDPEENAENFTKKLAAACQSHSGNLHSCKFRSVYWRYYLGCLSSKRECWVDECAIYRELYENLKTQYLPISDTQLITNIEQDVRRTMPDLTFFRDDKIHQVMTRILTVWSIASPGGQRLSYRQGIHELLAPIIFVINLDQESLTPHLHSENVPSDLKCILDSNFLEHDAFLLLSRLMYHVEPWYGTNKLFREIKNLPHIEIHNNIASLLDGRMPRTEQDFESDHIDTKLQRIHDILLKNIDHELYHHLMQNDFIPQVYGIRWLRLLFSREFSLQDSLSIWDCIFVHCSQVQSISKFTDYIFISMLLDIKPQLIAGDEQSCVTTLMRYPPIEDISIITRRAQELMENHQLFVPQTNQTKFDKDVKEFKAKALSAGTIFANDVTSSFSEMKMLFQSKIQKTKSNSKRQDNGSMPSTVEICTRQLDKDISKLQDIVLSKKTEDMERLPLVLANLKQTRDVMKGILPVETLQ